MSFTHSTPALLRSRSASIDSDVLLGFVAEFRRKFIEEGYASRLTSPVDEQLVMRTDWWLHSFLQAYNYDLDIARAVVLECLKWRQQFDVDHISLLELKPLLDRRLMYVHGEDLEGNAILWFRLCAHSSGDRLADRLFIFWLERHVQENRNDGKTGITMLVDMTATTFQHADFDLWKLVLHATKFYYPGMVRKLMVVDTPPALSASWKVIRSWMTAPGHPTFVQCSSSMLLQYVDRRTLPTHLGGSDAFLFTMDELAKCGSPGGGGNMSTSLPSSSILPQSLQRFPSARSVKFFDEPTRREPLTLTRGAMLNGAATTSTPNSRDFHRASHFCSVSPKDEIKLRRDEKSADAQDPVDLVLVRNDSRTSKLIFKMKTTSPEKFRVRPSQGVVEVGATETIRIFLHDSENAPPTIREKFLLMIVELEEIENDGNLDDFAAIWNRALADRKVEHKLKCRWNANSDTARSASPASSRPASRLEQHVELEHDLVARVAELSTQQRLLFTLLALLFAFQLWTWWTERANYEALRNLIQESALLKKGRRRGGTDEL